MGQGKKQKGKSGKARETSRREEPDTARAGEADELSTSQEPEDPFDEGNSGDEDTSTPQLSKPFTDRQDKQIAAFSSANTHVFTTRPILTTRTRRREMP